MRAGAWLTFRDFDAAYASWRRAQQVADRLADDDPDRRRMQIEPRSQMAGRAWRSGVNGGMLDPGFEELRDLCDVAGDRESLALGMAGLVTEKVMHGRRREAANSADELARLLERIDNPTLTIALSLCIMSAKVETGEAAEVLRLTESVIELAAGILQWATWCSRRRWRWPWRFGASHGTAWESPTGPPTSTEPSTWRA